MEELKILHIDDEKWMHQLVKSCLPSNYQLQYADDIHSGLEIISRKKFDLILLDRHLNKIDSFNFIEQIKAMIGDTILVVLSSDADGSSIAFAIEKGADDYLIKSEMLKEELLIRIRLVLKNKKTQAPKVNDETYLIGDSAYTVALREKIAKVVQTQTNVLITGESGSGKEVIAKEIHRLTNQPERPFVVLNCGAIPDNLFESELFGHLKGSFTGATSDKKGAVLLAHGGDLFLDEVGELPLNQQVKLLRFLQDGSFSPVGSMKIQKVNVRVIAATNKNLEQAIKEKTFREDLFYRLDIYRIQTKALSERYEDIAPLANYFTKIYSGGSAKLTADALKLLEKAEWKGNVRELSAAIQRAIVEASGEKYLRAIHFKKQNIAGIGSSVDFIGIPTIKQDVKKDLYEEFLETNERKYLEAALALYHYDTFALGKALGLSRATIYNKIAKLKIKMEVKL